MFDESNEVFDELPHRRSLTPDEILFVPSNRVVMMNTFTYYHFFHAFLAGFELIFHQILVHKAFPEYIVQKQIQLII